AHCIEHWWTREPDQADKLRRVLRYRLRFDGPTPSSAIVRRPLQRPVRRQSRSFDPDAPPPTAPRPGQPGSTAEERAQMHEKANKGHHELVKALALRLVETGWSEIEEVPGGFDLSASKANQRVIFEAKTLRNANAAHQVRFAIAQLFEYRFLYGSPN